KSIFDAISLRIQTQGYDFIPGTEVIAVIYRIYYRVMNTLCPRAILKSKLGTTVAVHSNCLTTNIAVNRLINWNELRIPTEWVLPRAVVPRSRFTNQIPNEDDIPYHFSGPSSRPSVSRHSTSEPIIQGIRLSEQQIPHGIYHFSGPSSRPSVSRHSTSEPIIQGIRLSEQQIPHGIYNDPSPSTRIEVDQTTSPLSKASL
ncbi:hypothetical protein GIB67_000533, partial [Kingdonia uniflora]